MRALAALAFLGAAAATSAAAGEIEARALRARDVATCDALVLGHPDEVDAYRCYFLVALRHRRWNDAATRLEARLAVDPGDALARYALGVIEAYRPGERGLPLLSEAAERLASIGDVRGEARARESLMLVHASLGHSAEAVAERERFTALAERSHDPALDADARLAAGFAAIDSARVARARDLFASLAEDPAVGPDRRARAENGLGNVAWIEGRLEEARRSFERACALNRDAGNRWQVAGEAFNVALVTSRLVEGGRASFEALRAASRVAIEEAHAAGNLQIEAQARLLLADDPRLPLDARIAEADRALELARGFGRPEHVLEALRATARLRLDRGGPGDRATAAERIDAAISRARDLGSLEQEARSWVMRATWSGARESSPETLESYARAIDLVERMRDLRSDATARGRFLWDWEFVYQRRVGALLGGTRGSPDGEAVDDAFRTLERLRARILIDVLDAAGATANAARGDDPAFEPLHAEREALLDRIVEIRRGLWSPGASDAEQIALRRELTRLERRAATLRESMARIDPEYGLLRRPAPVGVDEVRALLADDEAMIAFQAAPGEPGPLVRWWGGGSWAIVVDAAGARAYALPGNEVLGERVDAYAGILRGGKAPEQEASARLYDDVLRDAVSSLSDRVRRLVIVPDGPLHRLPFPALRPSRDADPIATRFRIETVPSASLWVHWRRDPGPPLRDRALVLADPELPVSRPANDPVRVVPRDVAALARLPGARAEARAVASALGGRADVRLDRAASEAALRAADLRPYGLVHLAVHALVHQDDASRTVLALAPGASSEDGLVHLHEIVSLRLDGQVVVLSACSSAAGEVTHGEGVLGLARAFFVAGAHTVVGGLWPLRDRDARAFIEAFAASLGRGATVGEAVGEARRKRIAAGDPPAAWAGWVVLGDGGRRIVSPGDAPGSGRSALLFAVGALGGLAVLLGLRRRG